METTRLIVVAVGGQGNLLASKVLGEAALLDGVPVRMSEIHGMAQRGGVVESAIVFGDVGSTIISDGEADILLGFEPSEVVRAMGRCNSRTRVITNTAPLRPFTVAIGQGVYPDVDEMMSLVRERVADLIAIDALALARQAGSPMTMNIVLLGALIASGALGLSRASVEKAITLRAKKAFVEMNLKAFRLGEGAVATA
ncbi:MAG: indolepyruvate oxidoreductase subunit beta [Desulfobacterium sp.]